MRRPRKARRSPAGTPASPPVSPVRNRRGESVVPSMIPATSVKNGFGRVLDTVTRGSIVVITKHNAPQAVMLSMDDFMDLATARHPNLEALSQEFDQMLARMQKPRARAGMKAAFAAKPRQLGAAAASAARKRA